MAPVQPAVTAPKVVLRLVLWWDFDLLLLMWALELALLALAWLSELETRMVVSWDHW